MRRRLPIQWATLDLGSTLWEVRQCSSCQCPTPLHPYSVGHHSYKSPGTPELLAHIAQVMFTAGLAECHRWRFSFIQGESLWFPKRVGKEVLGILCWKGFTSPLWFWLSGLQNVLSLIPDHKQPLPLDDLCGSILSIYRREKTKDH